MARTSNIFARVEPSVKEEAEHVLSEFGIPMSGAVEMFLRQVVIHRGIPFEIKLDANAPVSVNNMTKAELDAELEKGIADIKAGSVRSMDEVHAEIRGLYNK